MAYKPSIPKGTRDFSPEVVGKRNFIFGIIREVYERCGYMPVETPAMENLETLTGKYGAEGDKLLFRILNSGDFLDGVDKTLLSDGDSNSLSRHIAGKGLRYDLTVPFARYVVQHRNEITFPFKRYQIQPVWRADRPQRGRYREFFQCDADVIGSDSLLNEIELVHIIDEVFLKLGIKVSIRLNNRKILLGLAEATGVGADFYNFTVIIDKLDKTGIDNVMKELAGLRIDKEHLDSLKRIFIFEGNNEEKLSLIGEMLAGSETGQKGIEEMQQLLTYHKETGTRNTVTTDITLARGLNYYTGTIFEVTALDVAIGSLCGGGRYDDLTGIFGMPGLSGVGISFGADRIYDVMQELKLFGDINPGQPKVLFVNFGAEDEIYSLKALTVLRSHGISAEMYPDAAKIKKQMSYADARKIPFVVLAGEEERKSGQFRLKDMSSGDQLTMTLNTLIETIR